ncbi:MAG: hypothetical protein J6P16_00650 [Eubacterium sp.]|nr:hypothetical protein [Eubacterium sp.]
MTVMSLDEVKNLPPLSDEEKKIIQNAHPTPTDDCPAMTRDELNQFHPWYDRNKQSISFDMDISVINYFRNLSVDTDVPYLELMKMFLTECAHEKKRPVFK